mmetsp:Transcript_27232/g.49990  ORF Transcript_27232/g.49990 Transcript_27232/m.49990 type:complete len:187 (+) Transcript_27232:135-695(+)
MLGRPPSKDLQMEAVNSVDSVVSDADLPGTGGGPPGKAECCPAGHQLLQKLVGSGFHLGGYKSCSRCKCQLTPGMVRHSCKECNHHLCQGCRAVIAVEELHTEIRVFVHKLATNEDHPPAAHGGHEHDGMQVSLQRGGTTNDLKELVEERLDLPVAGQTYFQKGIREPVPGNRRLGDGEHLFLKVS